MKSFTLLLFTVFAMQSCKTQQDPTVVLKNYYAYGNQLIQGDTTHIDYLKTHLSDAATASVEKLPFLFEYSLIALTKKGTLNSVDVLSTKEITKDSVVLNVVLNYKDTSKDTTHQSIVFEKELWKISLSAKQ